MRSSKSYFVTVCVVSFTAVDILTLLSLQETISICKTERPTHLEPIQQNDSFSRDIILSSRDAFASHVR